MKIVGSSIQLAYDLMLVVSIIYFFYHLEYCYYIFYFNKYIGPSHLVLIDNVTMNSCVKELCWTPSWTKVQFSPRSQAQLLDIKQECRNTQAGFQAKPDELTRASLAKVIDDLYIATNTAFVTSVFVTQNHCHFVKYKSSEKLLSNKFQVKNFEIIAKKCLKVNRFSLLF